MRHPSDETLEKLVRGQLIGWRLETVLAHLRSGCRPCQEALEPMVSLLIIDGRLPRQTGTRTADYDGPLDAAFTTALRRFREVAVERSAAPRQAEALCDSLIAERGQFSELPEGLRKQLSTWSICEELLRRSADLRFDDPAGMAQIARLAVDIAVQLDPARCGREPLADLQARAWAEYGNALRVQDDLRGADHAFARAADIFPRGSRDPLLAARVAELTSSLRAHQRRFRESFQLLQEAQDIYERKKDRTSLGRVLIMRGIYSGYDGDAEGAVKFLQGSLKVLQPRRDAKLRFLALHNLALFMAERGQYREARVRLFEMQPLYNQHAGKMDRIRLRGLEGTIAAGLGELEKAERAFRAEKEGFEKAGLHFAAAIADLELVTVWLRQGTMEKHQQARRTIARLVDIFRGIGVEREALGAMLLLSEAQMRENLTVELVEATVRVLRQVDRTPGARA